VYTNIENLKKEAGVIGTAKALAYGTVGYHLGKHVKEQEYKDEIIENMRRQAEAHNKYASLERRVLEKKAASILSKAIGRGLSSGFNRVKNFFRKPVKFNPGAVNKSTTNIAAGTQGVWTPSIKSTSNTINSISDITKGNSFYRNGFYSAPKSIVEKSKDLVKKNLPKLPSIEGAKVKAKESIQKANESIKKFPKAREETKALQSQTNPGAFGPVVDGTKPSQSTYAVSGNLFGSKGKRGRYLGNEVSTEFSSEGLSKIAPTNQFDGILQNPINGEATGKAIETQNIEKLRKAKPVKVDPKTQYTIPATNKTTNPKIDKHTISTKGTVTGQIASGQNKAVEYLKPLELKKDITGTPIKNSNPELNLSIEPQTKAVIRNAEAGAYDNLIGKGKVWKPGKDPISVRRAAEEAAKNPKKSWWDKAKERFSEAPKTKEQRFAENRFGAGEPIQPDTNWSEVYNSTKNWVKNNPGKTMAGAGALGGIGLYSMSSSGNKNLDNYYYGGYNPMYNQYNAMNKTAASYGKNLFSDLATFAKKNKGYFGRTGGAFGDAVQAYNPFAKENIKTFGNLIAPNNPSTAFLGKTRRVLGNAIASNPNAVRAAVAGVGTGTAGYGAYKMVTSSVNEDDMALEYDAAANQAAFAENMYNEAVEKMASIEDYMEKEAANPVARAVYNTAGKAVRYGNKLQDSANYFGLGSAFRKKGVGNAIKARTGASIATLASLAQKNPNVAAALAAGAVGAGGVAGARAVMY